METVGSVLGYGCIPKARQLLLITAVAKARAHLLAKELAPWECLAQEYGPFSIPLLVPNPFVSHVSEQDQYMTHMYEKPLTSSDYGGNIDS